MVFVCVVCLEVVFVRGLDGVYGRFGDTRTLVSFEENFSSYIRLLF